MYGSSRGIEKLGHSLSLLYRDTLNPNFVYKVEVYLVIKRENNYTFYASRGIIMLYLNIIKVLSGSLWR